jgi:alkylation response protein AidB-like acyl-CoA dehydrogenase
MATHLTPDQLAIRDAARGFLRENCGLPQLRATIESGAGCNRPLWHRFAAELGFASLAIAPEYGGAGLGPIELALVAEELGAVLAPIPWFETAVLAAGALQEAGGSPHLADIAAGTTSATLALRGAGTAPLLHNIGPTITAGRLHGTAHYVPFGAYADLLLVAAREAGISLLALPANTPGIRVEQLVSMDATRPLAHVHFDNIDITQARVGAPGAAGPALARTLAQAAAILAAEQVGGMQRSLDETVAYSLQRVQFGRLIGSFQALKHRMADMKLLLEAARSATLWATTQLASNAPDAATACAAARAYCTDAYLAIAADAIQLHGGIGFTWDHHAHWYFKRARGSATLLDTQAILREQVAQTILNDAIT